MNGIENGLHCVACQVLGIMVVAGLLIGLVSIGAWGPLAFILFGAPLVGVAERVRG